uniref:Uncharacterized protein n=1 Tax=Alexandrium monilatum TaxID=311494 RepID=A0A7S4VIK1_9DINO
METLPSRVSWTPTPWDGRSEIQDVLFGRQASDDVVEALASDEDDFLRALPGPAQPGLRDSALRLVLDAVADRRPVSEDSTWFWVVQVLDAGCALLEGDAPPEKVLARAAAACLSGLKLADDDPSQEPGEEACSCSAARLAELATRLSQQRGTRAVVSQQAVVAEQVELLGKLLSRLRAPTVAVWVQIMLVRFDVATRGLHAHLLGAVQARALALAQRLLQSVPVSRACKPRVLAAGACSVALCAEGVVQPEVLRRLCADEAAGAALAAAVAGAAAVGADPGRAAAAQGRAAAASAPQQMGDLLRFAAVCGAEQLPGALALGIEAAAPDRPRPRKGGPAI